MARLTTIAILAGVGIGGYYLMRALSKGSPMLTGGASPSEAQTPIPGMTTQGGMDVGVTFSDAGSQSPSSGRFDPITTSQINTLAGAAKLQSQAQGGLTTKQKLEFSIAVLQTAANSETDPTRRQGFLDKIAQLQGQLAALGG